MAGSDAAGASGTVRAPVPTWLVTGPGPGAREAAIAARLERDSQADASNLANPALASVPAAAADSGGLPALTVIILEGLSDGRSALAFDAADGPVGVAPVPKVLRIAPGCLHCSGNLVLRVTLNRVLRQRPARLYISLATAEHLDLLRAWLSEPPYGDLLDLQSDIAA